MKRIVAILLIVFLLFPADSFAQKGGGRFSFSGGSGDMQYNDEYVNAVVNPKPKIVTEYEYSNSNVGVVLLWIFVIIPCTIGLIVAGYYFLFVKRYNSRGLVTVHDPYDRGCSHSHERKNVDIPTITDPDDKAMIDSMDGTQVGGKIVLPSGLEIPPPPSSKCWYITQGSITLIDQPK